MNLKLKNIILILTLIGIVLGVFSFIRMDEYFSYQFDLPVILFSLLIVYFLLPNRIKIKGLNLFALGISIVFLISTSSLAIENYELYREGKILNEYSELNCEKINKRFQADLNNNEVKYFSFGLVGSGNLSKNIRKYEIENFDLGCSVVHNLECYNKLVREYLKENKNVDISNLYD